MHQKKPFKKKAIAAAALGILLCLLVLAGCSSDQEPRRTIAQWENLEAERIAAAGQSDVQYKGKVLEVVSDREETLEGDFALRTQTLKVRVTNGPFKGDIIEVSNHIDTTSAYNIILEQGQGIFFTPEISGQGIIENAFFTEMVRDHYIMVVAGLFLAALVMVGKLKGLRAAVSLALTAAAVLFILVPLILRGYNPVLISVLVGVGITIITLVIISGPNRKSFSAIAGTSCGIMIGGTLALVFGNLANLTGLSNDEAVMLMYIPQNIDFDFRGVLFAGIILASLGAVMDVSISISSSMLEIAKADPSIKKGDLMASGMNVGRDIIGTMSNTLILVYIASAIPLMLLFAAYQIPFIEIINKDLIASEVIRALSGTIGLILAIPITVLVSAQLYGSSYIRSLRRKELGI